MSHVIMRYMHGPLQKRNSFDLAVSENESCRYYRFLPAYIQPLANVL